MVWKKNASKLHLVYDISNDEELKLEVNNVIDDRYPVIR